jgi:hypothetical protein
LILQTYPPDAAGFLSRGKDRFTNPVGYTIHRETAVLLESILAEEEAAGGEITDALDKLIKIRAVQDFSASQAVAFIFALKGVLHEELAEVNASLDEILHIDDRIDRLALAAFDYYMKNRETIYQIKINEVKNRSNKLLQRANLMYEESGTQENSNNGGKDASRLKGGTGI